MSSRIIHPTKKNTGDFIFAIPICNLIHARQSALKTLEELEEEGEEEEDPFEELVKQWKTTY